MNNPIDNYNNLSLNKLNITPISSDKIKKNCIKPFLTSKDSKESEERMKNEEKNI